MDLINNDGKEIGVIKFLKDNGFAIDKVDKFGLENILDRELIYDNDKKHEVNT